MEPLLNSILLNASATNDPAATSGTAGFMPGAMPPYHLFDMLIPGFSVFSAAINRYLGLDLTIYIPLFIFCSGFSFVWNYIYGYFWGWAQSYLMSVCELRPDDELYWQVLSWVAAQTFAQRSRRFIANSSLSGRFWWYWNQNDDDDDIDVTVDVNNPMGNPERKKPLSYTPSFGSHSFWFRGRLLRFTRVQNREQNGGYMMASEKEEISISCFGRDPWILKELLLESRREHFKKDERKTFIYRGTTRNSGGDATWQRCMARTPRPFSTVILNETVKKDIVADMTDYLSPLTRRWYSNRGIPYRRGYLLHGPPGTGKSSLSLALAGFFKMRIYIVSLNSITASEENLSALFAELPQRCVVLLEDIDTAGLTHTREDANGNDSNSLEDVALADESGTSSKERRHKHKDSNAINGNSSRLSLSGLLNILDGVASQEGRILIMTTNHIDRLDKALIRPGRVDMMVKFGLADFDISCAIFRAIFGPCEVDNAPKNQMPNVDPLAEKKRQEEAATKRAELQLGIEELAVQFAEQIPIDIFSPAEIQGYLLKNKRDSQAAVDGIQEWVIKMTADKSIKEQKDIIKKMKAQAKVVRRELKESRRESRRKHKEVRAKRKRQAKKERKRREKKEKKEQKDKNKLEADHQAAKAVPVDGEKDEVSTVMAAEGKSKDAILDPDEHGKAEARELAKEAGAGNRADSLPAKTDVKPEKSANDEACSDLSLSSGSDSEDSESESSDSSSSDSDTDSDDDENVKTKKSSRSSRTAKKASTAQKNAKTAEPATAVVEANTETSEVPVHEQTGKSDAATAASTAAASDTAIATSYALGGSRNETGSCA